MSLYFYIALGLLAGIASGFLGIGGGTIIIPVLVYFVGFSQHQAQGTTLALMIPPIGLLAAMKYYQAGNVDIRAAIFICLGFLVGGLFGASFVTSISGPLLKKIFGTYLMIIAIKMIVGK